MLYMAAEKRTLKFHSFYAVIKICKSCFEPVHLNKLSECTSVILVLFTCYVILLINIMNLPLFVYFQVSF